jgi:hypothetical protein
MNRFAAYPQPVPGGYRLMMRFAKDSHPKPILGPGDKPIIYPTESAAWKACASHLLSYLNFPIVGETAVSASSNARSKADRLFLGGGKVVQVERLEAAR